MNKRFWLEYFPAWILLVILGLIAVHAPLTVVIGVNFPAIGDIVKAWKEIIMLIAVILLAVAVTDRKKWTIFAKDKLFWLILVFLTLNIAYFFFDSSVESVVGLAVNLRYFAYFALVYVFLKLYPKYTQSFMKVGAVAASIVVGFALLQLFLPPDSLKYLGYSDDTIKPYILVDENPDFVRINSTLRGPNPLSAYGVMALMTILVIFIKFDYRKFAKKELIGGILFAIGSLVAVWFGYSRSALVAAIVALGIVLITKYYKKISKIAWFGALAAGLVTLGMLYVLRDNSFVKNVIFHENPATESEVLSNDQHAASLMTATEYVIENPLGEGVGSTGSASLYSDNSNIVENQYLMIAHEIGWFGLAIYLVIIFVVMRRLWLGRNYWLALAAFASGVGLALIGLLLPVWADDTVSITWWGMAAIALIGGEKYGKSSNKKTKRTA